MEKDKFIEKMFQLGVELEKANDAFHCSTIINDAQILYKQQFEAKNNESLHLVGVREFECDDVVCTSDGKMWVITDIDGNDLLVTGNGKKDYPLEKSDITHAH